MWGIVARMERSEIRGQRERQPVTPHSASLHAGHKDDRNPRMTDPIQIRMGGYGPATTGFSRALKFIGERLEAQFGDRGAGKYGWNIMEFGYRAGDILWPREHRLRQAGLQ